MPAQYAPPDETEIAAARSFVRRSLADRGEVWEGRVYGEHAFAALAPAQVPYPYVVADFAAGGAVAETRGDAAEIVLDVIAVSEKETVAMKAAARIAYLLDDTGSQDGRPTAQDAGGSWEIVTVTREMGVHYSESTQARRVYYAGASYRFKLYPRPGAVTG